MSIWYLLFLSCFPGIISSAVVTLDSITIYNSHEWLSTSKPTVYFSCKGDNKNTVLPDVKDVNVTYTFKGEESWQPLTELASKKCKRCGFYEKDSFEPNDVFDVWELCASNFEESEGKYRRIKENEFDATFFCPQCVPLAADSNSAASELHDRGKGMHIFVVILIAVLVSTVLVLGVLGVYKYWQKKKREQDQARFLKLFEDGDDVEDELGLGNV